MATNDRVIPAVVHDDGSVSYSSVTSPASDTSPAVCYMVPMRIIPVIFVPGIMGSNLSNRATSPSPVWLVNSKLGMGGQWGFRGPSTRKKVLDPQKTLVYGGGDIPTDTVQPKEELQRRGWGEVGCASYGSFLPWLENALNDAHSGTDYGRKGVRAQLMDQLVAEAPGVGPLTYDEVALSYKYQFPVHAVGYNWLQSNVESANHLAEKIQEFTGYYRNKKYQCEKVILVTHSMGGLVARYYTELLAGAGSVLGVVHGVMPATGAASAYKRVKAGTEGVAGLVLGSNAAEVTAVFAQGPGALQLLPSTDYGPHWLKVRDFDRVVSLPQREPYSEIYLQRGKWWGLINDQLINPLDPKKRTVEKDWEEFSKLIRNHVKPFHEEISSKYHMNTYAFYGDDAGSDYMTWGDALWKRMVRLDKHGEAPSITNPWNYELVSDDGLGEQTVSSDSGVTAKHASFILQGPDESGDGTVPRRSGRAPLGKRGVQVCVPYTGVLHEGAYKDEPRQRFALWAITKIAYRVKQTSMAYPA